jgi:predicted permease
MTSQFTAFRQSWRRWRSAPLLPGLTVLVLAVGVGASAAVVSVAWATLLRPLPYPHAGDLMEVHAQFPRMKLASMGLSAPEAHEFGLLTRAFSSSGYGFIEGVPVTTGDLSVQTSVASVSMGLTLTLGASTSVGRWWSAEDDRPGAPLVAVVSDRFWRRQLGADSGAIGHTIIVDGRSARVAGVLPDGVDLAGDLVDVWIPLQFTYQPSDNASTRSRANHAFVTLARITHGTSLATARADVLRAERTWSADVGEMHAPTVDFHPLTLTPLADSLRGRQRGTTLLLIGAVALVLLIAAANASTLLLAQSESRRAEMAVRAALGAARADLWRGQAVETVALSVASALVAVAIAWGLQHALSAVAPADLAARGLIMPIWQTAAIALGLAGLCGLTCSLAPLSRLSLTRLVPALATESRGGTASRDRHRLRRLLVTLEIAVAVTLVAGAALLVESFWRLANVDPGFTPNGVLHTQVYLPSARYPDRGQIDGFYDAVLADLRHAPGVTAVGLMSGRLPNRFANNTSLQPDIAGLDFHGSVPPVQFLQFVDAGALAAIGLPVLRGRGVTPDDTGTSMPIALLNETAAAVFFPGADPLGRRIRGFGPGLPWLTIVGIVKDAHQAGLDRPVGTEIFVPIAQAANLSGLVMTRDLNIVIRVQGRDPITLAPALRMAVSKTDAAAALAPVVAMRDVVLRSVASPRFLATVLSAFALVALLLCAAGVYGIVMHLVNERTREIGVRRSLGAPAGAIITLVARNMAALAGAGLLAGMIGAAMGTRALASFTFHTAVASPYRALLVAAILAVVAVLACLLPVRRALRVDPAIALRRS